MFCYLVCFFFFKQKTAYEMRISDWSSDVCSSDLGCSAPFSLAIGASAHPYEPSSNPRRWDHESLRSALIGQSRQTAWVSAHVADPALVVRLSVGEHGGWEESMIAARPGPRRFCALCFSWRPPRTSRRPICLGCCEWWFLSRTDSAAKRPPHRSA